MSEEALLAQIEILRAEMEDLRNSVENLFSDDMGPQGSRGMAPDWFDAADSGDVSFELDDFGYELKADNTVAISDGIVSFDDIDLPADVEGDEFQLPIPGVEGETYFIWLDVDKVAVTTDGVSSVTAVLDGGLVVPTDTEQHVYITLYEFQSAAVDPEHPAEMPTGKPSLVKRCWMGSYVSQLPAWPEGRTPLHVKWVLIEVCVETEKRLMWVLGTEPFEEEPV